MIRLEFTGENPGEVFNNIVEFLGNTKGFYVEQPPLQEVPTTEEEIKPVISTERAEENLANAPVHELPPIPPMEDVRAALNALRAAKGTEAVKAVLAQYGASKFSELKEDDYLPVMELAQTEVQ